MQRNSIFSLAAVAALSIGGVACGSDSDTGSGDSGVTVSDARSRQPAEGQTRGVVYGVVSNPSDEDIQIESASSSVTDDTQLHDTEMADDGAMSMFEVEDGFTIPAGGEFVFEPGGPHVMLIDIDAATFPDEVEVTLELSEGDPVTFTAPVEEIGDAMGGMEMEEGDMSDMDHSDDDMGEMEEMEDGEEG